MLHDCANRLEEYSEYLTNIYQGLQKLTSRMVQDESIYDKIFKAMEEKQAWYNERKEPHLDS